MIRQAILSAAVALFGLWSGLSHAQWTPDIEAWNSPQPEQVDAVVFRNATVWTADEAGVLENTDLLVRNGRIEAIGSELRAPRDAMEIDATGMHLTPGIIDAHSHSAILGGVNEASRISTADVRIRDVIDPESINIYRQLAGGVTAINLLHGSANAIGGQMAVIKMRWGAEPDELVIDTAPPGIKFALGENPKQSNWSNDTPRYPRTRQGVAQIIREKFQQAADYQRAMDDAPRGRAARDRVPPRPDHELEAIAEIINGERDVHSHAYRADEMLALMRIAEDFDFTIRTFQHVLEGYKIAPQMAEHGVGGSTFIDWWAFKYEARDAIAFNPALMNESGVLTGLHSDDSELARRMNLEAAKAVRYGGVDEHEALMMITANPARQLGIGDRTGRLAEGLDADLVLWNGHPLSVYSRVEQTWVDGRRYFDREADQRMREALAAEREQLMALVLAEGEASDSDEGASTDADDAPELLAQHPAHASYLTGYRPSELAYDEFCHAHEH
ncbi:amidohydrolase [Wenzhouxiangella marina]|uniref:Amidohydrolase n=1 Tax=Wenzhouxiangella marina TaxID=1579979 RepID=A0A0K0XXB9_9GAMM|nr:amidohydrolase [Wenzhouxiangella marina]AKS42325.1 Amidohydrolase [Wenzhouxiangella marina]MBB6085902.1 imidazolonepropionase-like amidohydrolase [Wenzhouxiangella marina]